MTQACDCFPFESSIGLSIRGVQLQSRNHRLQIFHILRRMCNSLFQISNGLHFGQGVGGSINLTHDLRLVESALNSTRVAILVLYYVRPSLEVLLYRLKFFKGLLTLFC